jgi:uncharacterized protein (TIGR03435 family)
MPDPLTRTITFAACLSLASALSMAQAQSAFDVATIRPSSGEVRYERNGTTDFAYGTLRLHDVTLATCIHIAYNVPLPLIQTSPNFSPKMTSVHYDILARAAPETTDQEMRIMLQNLLRDRFHLAFQRETREMRVFALTIAKGGIKMHPSAGEGHMLVRTIAQVSSPASGPWQSLPSILLTHSALRSPITRDLPANTTSSSTSLPTWIASAPTRMSGQIRPLSSEQLSRESSVSILCRPGTR